MCIRDRFCVVQIGEDLGHGIHAQNGIELLALVGRQGCEGVGKVVLVVIRELKLMTDDFNPLKEKSKL